MRPLDHPLRDRAILIRIEDPQMQAYLQHYQFAAGPDLAFNERCRHTVRQSIEIRPPAASSEIKLLSPAETRLASTEENRVLALMDQLHIKPKKQRQLANDFSWKVNLIPRDANHLLVIGCGDGMELIFLRAVAPKARITAIDYDNCLHPALKELLCVHFIQGWLDDIIKSFPASFDLIFSNHVLEHLYTPDDTISSLARLLTPGGRLVSALPLDGSPDDILADEIRRLAADPTQIRALDFDILDAGHPWKTNSDDLRRTLIERDFTDANLYQRDGHFSRYIAGPRKRFQSRQQLGRMLNRVVFGTARGLINAIFRRQSPPHLIIKLFFAAEARLWFGANPLKNMFASEVLMVARRRDSSSEGI